MRPFNYHLAGSVEDACRRLREDPQARPLAGGMTLIPTLKHRLAQVSCLVDVTGLQALRGLHLGDGCLHLGAALCHQEVADAPEVAACTPGLARLAASIGDPQVRARGTLGGSVANNDPAADYPAAVLALDGVVCTDRREIAAADFFQGLFATALAPDELIVSVRLRQARRSAYAKFRHPASGYAMAGVFLADLGPQGLRVAVTGACEGVWRWLEAEQAWARGACPGPLQHPGLLEDMHAPATYRAHLAGVLFAQALAELSP